MKIFLTIALLIFKLSSFAQQQTIKSFFYSDSANQSSPLDIYKNMLPAIKGNHFRLSNDEWNVISEKFKIGGIPRYLLVGKYGRVINDNLPPLKNEELKEILLTATKL